MHVKLDFDCRPAQQPQVKITCHVGRCARLVCKRYTGFTAGLTDDLILGIETSCDDTGVAVVSAGGRILSDSIASQVMIRKLTSGSRCLYWFCVNTECPAPGRCTRSLWRSCTKSCYGSSQSSYGHLCRGSTATSWSHCTGPSSRGCINWPRAKSLPKGLQLHRLYIVNFCFAISTSTFAL